MKFKDKKFQAIRYYVTLELGNYVESERANITFFNNVRDLGIIISHDLTFNEHINIITAKGKQMAYGITVGHIAYPTLLRELKARSVLTKCCTLFNCLPAKLRREADGDSTDYNKFKGSFDTWLASIPDQPTVPGRFRPALTNSIIHQKQYSA